MTSFSNLSVSAAFPRFLLTLTWLCAATPIYAQSIGPTVLPEDTIGQEVGMVGGGVFDGSKYQGSQSRRALGLPVIDYHWANGLFAGDVYGFGVNLGGNGPLQIGPQITFDLGRKADLDPHLNGMGDIPIRAMVGGFANLRLFDGFYIASSIANGQGSNDNGALASIGVSYSHRIGDRWIAGASTMANFANKNYMQSYFGVNANQSTQSGYMVYSPSGGFRDVTQQMFVRYGITQQLSLITSISANRLGNEAKESPVTQKIDSASVFSGLTYRF